MLEEGPEASHEFFSWRQVLFQPHPGARPVVQIAAVGSCIATFSRICICSPCYQPWALTASMLADASLPRGFDADLSIAGRLSERFRQVVAFPL